MNFYITLLELILLLVLFYHAGKMWHDKDIYFYDEEEKTE